MNAERSAKELTILLNAAEKKIKEQEEFIATLQQQMDGAPVIKPVIAPKGEFKEYIKFKL